METARADLLERIVDDVAGNGLADRSLRELAAAVGSSHRMLHYHFGSREGLVRAIVEHVEATQRGVLVELAANATDSPSLVRALWARVSSEELRPLVRLFFEAVAYSSRDGAAGGVAAVDFTSPWLDDGAGVALGIGVEFDPVAIRLGIAVVRGLLIDVVSAGDLDAATDSLEYFLELWSSR